MSMLFNTIRDLVSDRRTAAFVHESELSPLGGAGRPVAPPTYAVKEGESPHAFTADAFIPTQDDSGWHTELRRDPDGNLLRAGQVVISSIPAESGRNETACWLNQARIGVTLPGIIVGPPEPDVLKTALSTMKKSIKASPNLAEQAESEARSTLEGFEVSTWTAAHRHNDAWVKYAANPDRSQIWEGGEIRDLITTASLENADPLFRNFLNAADFGMWLSSGVSRRHRVPRAYSSEIIGYEAHAVTRAATKLDAGGGASKDTALNLKDGVLTTAKGHKPSDYGFGTIPTSPHEAAYQCGKILQQSSISLPVFRSLRFTDDESGKKRDAAGVVLALLAITGHELAAEDGFLRSECSLARGESRWGRRITGRTGSAAIEEFEVADADAAAEALRASLAAAAEVGLELAAPRRVPMSAVQAAVIADRVAREITKTTAADD